MKRHPGLLASLLAAALLVTCERYHASTTVEVINTAAVDLHDVQLVGPCFARTARTMAPRSANTYWVFPCGEQATLHFQAATSSYSAVGYVATLPHGHLTFTVRPDFTVSASEAPSRPSP